MINGDNDPAEVPHRGGRFQFSLATLLAVVTIVSVFCSLAAWLGLPFIMALILAAGPIGGATIVRLRESRHDRAAGPISGATIVRMRKSRHDWAIIFWSGVITSAAWGVIVCGEGLLTLCLRRPEFQMGLFVVLLLINVPIAFFVGMVTGDLWNNVVWGMSRCWQLIIRRYRSGLPRENE